MKCPNCKKQLYAGAKKCFYCRTDIEKWEKENATEVKTQTPPVEMNMSKREYKQMTQKSTTRLRMMIALTIALTHCLVCIIGVFIGVQIAPKKTMSVDEEVAQFPISNNVAPKPEDTEEVAAEDEASSETDSSGEANSTEEQQMKESSQTPSEDASLQKLNPITIPERGQLTVSDYSDKPVDYRKIDGLWFISADDFLVALGYSYVHPGEGNEGDEGFIYDSESQCRYQKNGEVICFYKKTRNITLPGQSLALSVPMCNPKDSPWEIFVPAEEFLSAMRYRLNMGQRTIEH